MESALIVSCSERGTAFFTEMLRAASVKNIIALESVGEARRLLLERSFDLIIVNAPLMDESGESFSRYIAVNGISQIMLVVKSEYFNAVSSVCEDDGVLTISKPVDKGIFWSVLTLARATLSRVKRIQAENLRLVQKIEDIRIVDRAKCLLISQMNMDEKQAHRYIEKRAMDMRTTRRAIAEGILKSHENQL